MKAIGSFELDECECLLEDIGDDAAFASDKISSLWTGSIAEIYVETLSRDEEGVDQQACFGR